ncbi:phosphotyrosine protein phosphatase I superfamily [Gorgonomyces haynaldii]|nr:phosphotyrosine protein phosphatase I superfamily [Gorgonomyces haynaldii]
MNVMFVCLGNICRSPMAEAVFRDHVSRNHPKMFGTIDSSGTSSYHIGDDPDERTVQTLKEHNISVHHKGQQLKQRHFDEFDYILCMDDSNLSNAMKLKPKGSKAQVLLFGKFDPERQHNGIIKDPYYGGMDGFEINYQQCLRASIGFVESLSSN